MALSASLLLKGLAGLGAVAGTVTGVIFLSKKKEEPGKEDTVATTVPPNTPAPAPKPPTFEEKLEKKLSNLVTGDSKLCNKVSSSDQGKNKDPARYTCDANTKGTELKEALKFTTDGTNELKIKNQLKGEKIEIRENPDNNNFPFGIMLVLENIISDITLQENENTDIKTFKTRTNPEFKLENGKFKHAWTIENLGEKVGLECKKEGDKKICTLKEGAKINVFENSNKKVKGVTFTGELNWEEDQAEHNQGFKLTVANDIDLVGTNTSEKLLASQSYEIKASESENYTWYLAKKGCLV